MRTRLALSLLLVSVAHAGAQAVTVNSDTTLVPWGMLTERPRLRETPSVRNVDFPSMLEDARFGGEARLRVSVGADGMAKADRAAVEYTSHSMFAGAVLRAVGRWALTPPMRDGRAVRTTMQVFVSFAAVSDREVPTREINTAVSDSTGLHIVVGWELVPQTPGLVENPGDTQAAFISILSELVTIAGRTRASAICVRRDDASTAKLSKDIYQVLRAAHGDVRDERNCPPTFESMILKTDASGKPVARPKGSVDPMMVSALSPRLWTTDLYVLQGTITQGTGGTRYHCQAARMSPSAVWDAKCAPVSRFVY